MSDANVIIGVDVFFLQQSFFFGMMTVALILVQILFGIVTFDQAVGSLAKVVGGGGHKSGGRY